MCVAVCNLSQCVCLKASVRGLCTHVAVCTVCDHVFVLKPVFVMCSYMLLFVLFVSTCLS